jgi:hypothetical protein
VNKKGRTSAFLRSYSTANLSAEEGKKGKTTKETVKLNPKTSGRRHMGKPKNQTPPSKRRFQICRACSSEAKLAAWSKETDELPEEA